MGCGASSDAGGKPKYAPSAEPTTAPAKEADAGAPVSSKPADAAKRILAACTELGYFSDLTQNQLGMIVECMTARSFAAGDSVMKIGDPGDEFFVVDSGRFECFLKAEGEAVKTFGPAQAFGEMALMYNAPRNAAVRCAQAGQLWCLGRARFQEIQAANRRSSAGGGASCNPMSKFASFSLEEIKARFEEYDVSKSRTLSRSELGAMLSDIFGKDMMAASDSTGTPIIEMLLDALDTDGSGDVDIDEFEAAWRAWFGASLHPVRALLVIDVQNDFIDGSLGLKHCPAGQDGAQVVPVINQLREDVKFDAVAVSLDWHPQQHCSFIETLTSSFAPDEDVSLPAPLHPSQDEEAAKGAALFSEVMLTAPDGSSEMLQALWPRHCVQDTWGSKCHEDLKLADSDVIVYKGTDAGVDSYSAFFDNSKFKQTTLLSELRQRGVTHVYVCGLALDVCVAFTALHAAEEGFVVTVVKDACAGVAEEGIADKLKIMREAGVQIVDSADLPAIVERSSLVEALQAAHRIRGVKSLVKNCELEGGHGSAAGPTK